MRVQEWMTTVLVTVRPDDPVAQAQRLMRYRRIRHLPVVRDGRLVGIITDRDVRDAMPGAIAAAREAAATSRRRHAEEEPTVEATMTADVLTLAPGDTVVTAARMLRRERIGALPIVEGTRLVGILTRSDVLDAFIGLAELAKDERPEPRQ